MQVTRGRGRGRLLLRLLLEGPLLLVVAGWAVMALWLDGPSRRPLAVAAIAAYLLLSGAALLRVRPWRRALVAFWLVFALVLGWWWSLAPRNDRPWLPDVARHATAVIDGDRVTIRNVRNFDYRSATDFTPRWEERTYDLHGIRGVDLFLSYWGSPLIAHTIASWEFAEGPPLAISIETRKEAGESYSALRGFFRQYEVYYVVADERDVVRLRTNYRGEDVYLYRLRVPPARAREFLLAYLEEINRLAVQPRWYNAVTHNCTTTIRYHAQQVAPGNPWNWRLLVNGKLDELGYMRGQVATDLPFAELRRRSNITARAHAADQSPSFSARIRVGLPGADWRQMEEGGM